MWDYRIWLDRYWREPPSGKPGGVSKPLGPVFVVNREAVGKVCGGGIGEFNQEREVGSMGIISWMILGLLAGALAKLIRPGRDNGGWLNSMFVGIGGAMVGGFIGSRIGIGTVTGVNLWSILIATGGALLLLWVVEKLRS